MNTNRRSILGAALLGVLMAGAGTADAAEITVLRFLATLKAKSVIAATGMEPG